MKKGILAGWARRAGKDEKEVRKDVGRNRYFTPAQAIEYGIIDRIVRPQEEVRRQAPASRSACAGLLRG